MTISEINLVSLQKYFMDKNEVIVAYLFGSAVTGKEGLKKDIDIAVLVNDESAKRYIEIYSEIYFDLIKLLNRENIDVVIINEAPLLLRMEVLRNKKIIYERDITKRVDFEARTIIEYLDWKPMCEFFINDLEEKIREGRTWLQTK